MQILVIGGTKFIGPYVVEELVSLGHGVTVYTAANTSRFSRSGCATSTTPQRPCLSTLSPQRCGSPRLMS